MVSKAYKASLFESVASERKNLFFSNRDVPTEGLDLKAPNMMFGDNSQYAYTFDHTAKDKVDKLEVKGPINFVCRFKKKKGEWEVAGKHKSFGLKYEQREAGPDFAISKEYSDGPIKANMKFHPFTKLTKATAMYTMKTFSAAFDTKFNAGNLYKLYFGDSKDIQKEKELTWNVLCKYGLPFGAVGLIYSSKGAMAANFFPKPMMDGKLAVGVEALLPAAKEEGKRDFVKEIKVDAACSYKIDKAHEVKAKVGRDMKLFAGLKKTITSHCSLTVGTCFDLKDIKGAMTSLPPFGFKIALKP